MESEIKWTEPSPSRKLAPFVCWLLSASRWLSPVPQAPPPALRGLMPGPGRPSKLAEVALARTQTAPTLLKESRSPTRMVLLEPSDTVWMLREVCTPAEVGPVTYRLTT